MKLKNKNWPVWLIVVSFPVVSIIYGLKFYDHEVSPTGFGAFGDYVGGVLNPIFSALAVILLIHSLRQQNKVLAQQEYSLDIQRKELELSRMELSKSNEIHQQNLKLQSRKYLSPIVFKFHKQRREKLDTALIEEVSISQNQAGDLLRASLNYVFKLMAGHSASLTRTEKEKIFSWYSEAKESKNLKFRAKTCFVDYLESAFSLVEFIDYSLEMDSHKEEIYIFIRKFHRLGILTNEEKKKTEEDLERYIGQRILSEEYPYQESKI